MTTRLSLTIDKSESIRPDVEHGPVRSNAEDEEPALSGDQDGDSPMRGGDSPVQEDLQMEDEEESLPVEQHNGATTLNNGRSRVPLDWEAVTSLQPIVDAINAHCLEVAQLR